MITNRKTSNILYDRIRDNLTRSVHDQVLPNLNDQLIEMVNRTFTDNQPQRHLVQQLAEEDL